MGDISQPQLWQIGLLLAVFVIWFMLPLVPAILIHRLLPDNKIELRGPLNGLSVKASGGIASYILLLIMAYSFVASKIVPAISGLDDGSWEFRIPFMVQSAKGAPMIFDTGKLSIDVIANPNPSYRRDPFAGYQAELHTTQVGGRLPTVALVGHLSNGSIARSQPIDLERLAQNANGRTIAVPMRPLRIMDETEQ